ncbi:MAG: AMP-binding protein [Planctomycetota bacterium]
MTTHADHHDQPAAAANPVNCDLPSGSLHRTILRRLLSRPTAVAVTDDSRSYKGIEIIVAALHVATAIERATDKRHVGLLLPTSGATPIAALAAWMTGRVIVPLNYLLKPSELQYVVDHAGIDTIVTVQPMLDFLDEQPKVKTLLKLDEMNFKRLPRPRIPAKRNPTDLACLLYTSGTSGKPKGVMLTHGNVTASIHAACKHAEFQKGDTFLGVLPQFHCFGLIVLTLVPLAIGCPVVYTARFVPSKLLRIAQKHRPSVFVAIPAMYNALSAVKDPPSDAFTKLRYCVSGGEPLPEAVADAFKDKFGVTINEGFGMTETSAASHWCVPQFYKRHAVGPPLPGVAQRIVDIETGNDLPPGTDGELRLTGPMVMQGYYNDAEATAAAFDDQGYLRTGDMARIDEDGLCYITGRLKEMLIVGGENVFPREIEEVLCAHEHVAAAGVVGQPDPSRGEVPIAFVEAMEGSTLDDAELIRFCRDHLAGYKVPRRVVVLEKLPRNPTGKVVRRELKAMVESTA